MFSRSSIRGLELSSLPTPQRSGWQHLGEPDLARFGGITGIGDLETRLSGGSVLASIRKTPRPVRQCVRSDRQCASCDVSERAGLFLRHGDVSLYTPAERPRQRAHQMSSSSPVPSFARWDYWRRLSAPMLDCVTRDRDDRREGGKGRRLKLAPPWKSARVTMCRTAGSSCIQPAPRPRITRLPLRKSSVETASPAVQRAARALPELPCRSAD